MRYSKIYPASLCFCVFLAAVGVMLGDPAQIIPGIRTIILMEDALITDYIQIAGISAAFVNSALVTLISVGLLWLCREAPNGFTMVELGLMAGFALFGKNIANIWPIIAGTFLYAKVRREPFGKYVSIALLATALAPVVSYVAIDNGFGNLWWGIGVGVLIGFVLPPLAGHDPGAGDELPGGGSQHRQPLVYGQQPAPGAGPGGSVRRADPHRPVPVWTAGLGGLGGVPAAAAHHRTGPQRLPAHVRRRAGAPQHRHQRPHRHALHPGHHPSVQLAMLFGTTLAPISGYFGWPFGILAGFLHSSVVLHAGTPVEGVNLYNNGYSGGLLAIVLYPLLTEAIRHRRPELEDKDYFDVMEHDEPQIPPPARRR